MALTCHSRLCSAGLPPVLVRVAGRTNPLGILHGRLFAILALAFVRYEGNFVGGMLALCAPMFFRIKEDAE